MNYRFCFFFPEPRVINILIQGSGSFEVLSRAKFNKQNAKVVLTGRIEFISDENEVPKDISTVEEEEYEFTPESLNKILSDAGFQLGECFQSIQNINLKDHGKIVSKYCLFCSLLYEP